MTLAEAKRLNINLVGCYATFTKNGKTYKEYITDNYWLLSVILNRGINPVLYFNIVVSDKAEAKAKGYEKIKALLKKQNIDNLVALTYCEKQNVTISID